MASVPLPVSTLGAAAGSVFGPAGAIKGSVAGYLVASNVYQASLNILRAGRLAEKEANRVMAFCEAACTEMKKQREAFEKAAHFQLEIRRNELNKLFVAIDQGQNTDDLNLAINALAGFAELFGKKLKLQDFSEFDAFMKSKESLIL